MTQTDAAAWKARERDRIRSDLFVDYDTRKRQLKPPDGLKEEVTGGITIADQALKEVRKLRDAKMEADAVFQRGGMSRDMHAKQVANITDAMSKAVQQASQTIPKLSRAARQRLEERAFPTDVDRSAEAESVKADLREAFGSGAVDPQRWVERFDRGDHKERRVMLSRWGQDFVTNRGGEVSWDDLRRGCIRAAIGDLDTDRPMPDAVRGALRGLAMADDAQTTATLGLNIAAMVADQP